MTFQEWFNSEPHRAKYSNDHPAYLAAQEAWDAAHEVCAKVAECFEPTEKLDYVSYASRAIRARKENT